MNLKYVKLVFKQSNPDPHIFLQATLPIDTPVERLIGIGRSTNCCHVFEDLSNLWHLEDIISVGPVKPPHNTRTSLTTTDMWSNMVKGKLTFDEHEFFPVLPKNNPICSIWTWNSFLPPVKIASIWFCVSSTVEGTWDKICSELNQILD